MHQMDDRVFNQDCATYLRSLGIVARDGDRINSPFRQDADSGSFSVNGPLWNDFARGEGGNVWQLALLAKHGDRREAARSLCSSAGVAFIEGGGHEKRLTDRQRALDALGKVQSAFAIGDATPQEVKDYLTSRRVTGDSLRFFAYVPAGRLASALDDEEIALTGLRHREGLLILWYMVGGRPAYYCTRSIKDKKFMKAGLDGTGLEHPIWNVDDLYACPDVVWAEGMFDCVSLKTLGFGVAGEITCHPVKAHLDQLVKALRWRRKHHPSWRFTICLDNDEPTTDSRRPGNEAAEKLATGLWRLGLDVGWVRHDPAGTKVDVNAMHQAGQADAIGAMIEGSRPASELLGADPALCRDLIPTLVVEGDYQGVQRLAGILKDKSDDPQERNKDVIQIVAKALSFRHPYGEFYEGIEMCRYDELVYVIHPAGWFRDGQQRFDAFKKGSLIDNVRQHQRNPAMRLTLDMLDIPARRPDWRVSREPNDPAAATFNLFAPSPLLMQEPRKGAPMPESWGRLLDNVAGLREREWLLNHMATYVQTLGKPRTIPILLGKQGTGKTTLMEQFGKAIGDCILVDNAMVESGFNDWKTHAVIILDELANSDRDAVRLKNTLKGLVNERQSVNAKFRHVMNTELNNYVAITSNEQVTCVPVVIEEGDRRYTVVCGGRDENLAHAGWFDHARLVADLPAFMLHLLSRDIDAAAANVPLMNAKKAELLGLSEDIRVAVVGDWVDRHRGSEDDSMTGREVADCINELKGLKNPLTPKKLAPILAHLGVKAVFRRGQNFYLGLSSIEKGPEEIDFANSSAPPAKSSELLLSGVKTAPDGRSLAPPDDWDGVSGDGNGGD